MKFLFIILMLVSTSAFSATDVKCQVVSGYFENSPNIIENLRFETVVDVFSISNARTLAFTLDGKELKFLRAKLASSKQTQMIFEMKSNNEIDRVARVLLDRSPFQVHRTHEFYGNIVISGELEDLSEIYSGEILTKNLSYNFYCNY